MNDTTKSALLKQFLAHGGYFKQGDESVENFYEGALRALNNARFPSEYVDDENNNVFFNRDRQLYYLGLNVADERLSIFDTMHLQEHTYYYVPPATFNTASIANDYTAIVSFDGAFLSIHGTRNDSEFKLVRTLRHTYPSLPSSKTNTSFPDSLQLLNGAATPRETDAAVQQKDVLLSENYGTSVDRLFDIVEDMPVKFFQSGSVIPIAFKTGEDADNAKFVDSRFYKDTTLEAVADRDGAIAPSGRVFSIVRPKLVVIDADAQIGALQQINDYTDAHLAVYGVGPGELSALYKIQAIDDKTQRNDKTTGDRPGLIDFGKYGMAVSAMHAGGTTVVVSNGRQATMFIVGTSAGSPGYLTRNEVAGHQIEANTDEGSKLMTDKDKVFSSTYLNIEFKNVTDIVKDAKNADYLVVCPRSIDSNGKIVVCILKTETESKKLVTLLTEELAADAAPILDVVISGEPNGYKYGWSFLSCGVSDLGNCMFAILAKDEHLNNFVPAKSNLATGDAREPDPSGSIPGYKLLVFSLVSTYVPGTTTATSTQDKGYVYKWVEMFESDESYNKNTTDTDTVMYNSLGLNTNCDWVFRRYSYAAISRFGRSVAVVTGSEVQELVIKIAYTVHTFLPDGDAAGVISGGKWSNLNYSVTLNTAARSGTPHVVGVKFANPEATRVTFDLVYDGIAAIKGRIKHSMGRGAAQRVYTRVVFDLLSYSYPLYDTVEFFWEYVVDVSDLATVIKFLKSAQTFMPLLLFSDFTDYGDGYYAKSLLLADNIYSKISNSFHISTAADNASFKMPENGTLAPYENGYIQPDVNILDFTGVSTVCHLSDDLGDYPPAEAGPFGGVGSFAAIADPGIVRAF